MAVRGFGFIDEIQWEGANTVGVHIIYTGLDATNPHDPEVYGGFWVNSVSPGLTQSAMDADLMDALQARLENEHGFTFEIGDSVRLHGSGL